MSTNDTYLAIFVGSKTSARVKAWNAMSESERAAKQKEGGAAWGAWMAKHGASIVASGGPLGKTKRVSERGVEDTATSWALSSSCARRRMKRPPRCSRTIRISRSSPAKR